MRVMVLYDDVSGDEQFVAKVLHKEGDWSRDKLFQEFEDQYGAGIAEAQKRWKELKKRGYRSAKFTQEVLRELGALSSFYDFLLSKGFEDIDFATDYM